MNSLCGMIGCQTCLSTRCVFCLIEYIYIYIYTHIHTYIHTYIYIYIYIYMYTYIHACVYMYMCIYTHISLSLSLYIYIYMYICIHLYIYFCTILCPLPQRSHTRIRCCFATTAVTEIISVCCMCLYAYVLCYSKLI